MDLSVPSFRSTLLRMRFSFGCSTSKSSACPAKPAWAGRFGAVLFGLADVDTLRYSSAIAHASHRR